MAGNKNERSTPLLDSFGSGPPKGDPFRFPLMQRYEAGLGPLPESPIYGVNRALRNDAPPAVAPKQRTYAPTRDQQFFLQDELMTRGLPYGHVGKIKFAEGLDEEANFFSRKAIERGYKAVTQGNTIYVQPKYYDRPVPNAPKVEILRWWTALSGVALWFGYFWIALAGLEARGKQYCVEKLAAGENCSYDYLPVFEVIGIPAIILIGAYFFARFAYDAYAPPVDARTLGWRLASSDAGSDFPVLQIVAALGFAWSLYRLSALPFAFIPSFVIVYWIAWILWFASAIVVSWPRKAPSQGKDDQMGG